MTETLVVRSTRKPEGSHGPVTEKKQLCGKDNSVLSKQSNSKKQSSITTERLQSDCGKVESKGNTCLGGIQEDVEINRTLEIHNSIVKASANQMLTLWLT